MRGKMPLFYFFAVLLFFSFGQKAQGNQGECSPKAERETVMPRTNILMLIVYRNSAWIDNFIGKEIKMYDDVSLKFEGYSASQEPFGEATFLLITKPSPNDPEPQGEERLRLICRNTQLVLNRLENCETTRSEVNGPPISLFMKDEHDEFVEIPPLDDEDDSKKVGITETQKKWLMFSCEYASYFIVDKFLRDKKR